MEENDRGWLSTAETKLPYDKPTNFYQLCAFAGMDKKHLVRKFIFKSPGEYLDVKLYKITPAQYKKFIRNTPMKYYKVVSTYDFESVPYPLIGEALMMRVSTPSILTQKKCKDINYASYRTFNNDISFK